MSYSADDEAMVAGFVHGFQIAVDERNCLCRCRVAGRRGEPVQACELVVPSRRDLPARVLLVDAQDFTQNRGLDARRDRHDDDMIEGRKATSGGSSETDVNQPTVIPNASPRH